jgi:hypothetical protein
VREDRAAAYVDGPLMTQRIRYGHQLLVRINGIYGVYRTQAYLGRRGDDRCTCPSDLWPCKHVRAVRRTWRANPGSFLNLKRFLKKLSLQPKPALIAAIAQMVLMSPEGLSVFGVRGFEMEPEDRE